MPALRDGAGLPPPGMAQDDPSADGDRARHQPRLPVPAAGLRLRPHGVPLGPGGGAAGEGVGLRPGRGGAHRPPAVHRAPHAGRDLAGTGHALAPRHLRAPRAEPAGGVPGAAAGQPARRARAKSPPRSPNTAGSSSPWTGCSPSRATSSCGWCGRSSAGPSSARPTCSRRPPSGWRACSSRCGRRGCRCWGWSATRRSRSAWRWPRCSRGCPTSCASGTPCGRRPSPSGRPTAIS